MSDESKPKFLLIYGTQTGQSKAISEEIVERCERAGLCADIHCFSKIDKEFVLENEHLVVIVCSTTGDGEPPDTVLKFWRRIKRRTVPKDHLSKVKYALLGLGDSNYSQFCNCPQMMNKRLLEVGATHFMPPEWGDDAVGLEIAVEPWIDKLLAKLCEKFGLPPPSDDNKAKTCFIKEKSEIEAEQNQKGNAEIDNSTPAAIVENGVTNGGLTNGDCDKVTALNANKEGLTLSELIKQNMTLDDSVKEDLSSTQQSTKSIEAEIEQPAESTTSTAAWLADVPVLDASEMTLPSSPASYITIEYLTDGSSIDMENLPIQNNCKLPFANSPVHSLSIRDIEVMTHPEAVKKTLHVTLESEDVMDYQSGDSFSILAKNDHREVTWLLKRLGVVKNDAVLKLSVSPDTTKKKPIVPEFINNPSTLLEIFTKSLDIRTVPKKAFLKLLACFCSAEDERRQLLYLSSRQGADLYKRLITESRRGFLHIIHDFSSCKPSLESLIENLPRLLPRAYSIASQSHGHQLSFAFNVLELPDIGHINRRYGLVTGMFNSLLNTDLLHESKVNMYLRTQQHFRLPEDSSLPLILIGPGTGVAPYIGFLQDRKKKLDEGLKLGECLLFFGNRHSERDYLFKDELQRHLSAGSLSELHVCFSRDVESCDLKYVTNLMRQRDVQRKLSDLITKQSAYIYVCGDARNMAKDVSQALSDILKTQNGYTDDEVVTAIKELRVEKRYKEDVWT